MDAQIATLTAAFTSMIFVIAPSPEKKPEPSPMVVKMEKISKLTQDVAKELGVKEDDTGRSPASTAEVAK